MKFSDGQSKFLRVFNFTIIGCSRNSGKLDVHEKLVFYQRNLICNHTHTMLVLSFRNKLICNCLKAVLVHVVSGPLTQHDSIVGLSRCYRSRTIGRYNCCLIVWWDYCP